jgi:hypothetical protein
LLLARFALLLLDPFRLLLDFRVLFCGALRAGAVLLRSLFVALFGGELTRGLFCLGGATVTLPGGRWLVLLPPVTGCVRCLVLLPLFTGCVRCLVLFPLFTGCVCRTGALFTGDDFCLALLPVAVGLVWLLVTLTPDCLEVARFTGCVVCFELLLPLALLLLRLLFWLEFCFPVRVGWVVGLLVFLAGPLLRPVLLFQSDPRSAGR